MHVPFAFRSAPASVASQGLGVHRARHSRTWARARAARVRVRAGLAGAGDVVGAAAVVAEVWQCLLAAHASRWPRTRRQETASSVPPQPAPSRPASARPAPAPARPRVRCEVPHRGELTARAGRRSRDRATGMSDFRSLAAPRAARTRRACRAAALGSAPFSAALASRCSSQFSPSSNARSSSGSSRSVGHRDVGAVQIAIAERCAIAVDVGSRHLAGRQILLERRRGYGCGSTRDAGRGAGREARPRRLAARSFTSRCELGPGTEVPGAHRLDEALALCVERQPGRAGRGWRRGHSAARGLATAAAREVREADGGAQDEQTGEALGTHDRTRSTLRAAPRAAFLARASAGDPPGGSRYPRAMAEQPSGAAGCVGLPGRAAPRTSDEMPRPIAAPIDWTRDRARADKRRTRRAGLTPPAMSRPRRGFERRGARRAPSAPMHRCFRRRPAPELLSAPASLHHGAWLVRSRSPSRSRLVPIVCPFCRRKKLVDRTPKQFRVCPHCR